MCSIYQKCVAFGSHIKDSLMNKIVTKQPGKKKAPANVSKTYTAKEYLAKQNKNKKD